MNLLARIAQDQLKARKDRDVVKATLLTTLLGEAISVGKNKGNRESTDDEVVKVIGNFIKNATENADRWNNPEPYAQNKRLEFLKEVELLTPLLPPKKIQMTESTIRGVIKSLVSDRGDEYKKPGPVMKHFKEYYAGHYDGKLVASILSHLDWLDA
jgi:hypothetical protein